MKKPYPKWPYWTPEQQVEYDKVMLESTRPLSKDVGYVLSRELLAGIRAQYYYEDLELIKRLEDCPES